MSSTRPCLRFVLVALAALVAGCGEVQDPDADPDARDPGMDFDGGTGDPDAGPDDPPVLEISPADQNLGSVVVGNTSATTVFSVQNTGGSATAALSSSLSGDAEDFTVVGDDCDGMELAAGDACDVSVQFSPASAGAKAAELSVGDGDVSASATVDGTGLEPGALTMDPTSHDFDELVIDAGQDTVNFTVTNTGGAPTGTLAVDVSGAAFALADSTCSGTLDAGASCVVTVAFDPATVGGKVGSVTVQASPGGAVAASVGGVGSARITVQRAGSGTGTVTSTPAGITCGTTCTGTFTSANVTLTAAAGASSQLVQWSGGGCAGASPTCALTTTQSHSVIATFDAEYQLSVEITGFGAGAVSSSDGTIDCPGNCSGTYLDGTTVTLIASPDSFSTLTDFSGVSCSGNTCTVTVNADTSTLFVFTAPPKRVFVTSQVYPGSAFQGEIALADEECQVYADEAQLGGQYFAWMANGQTSPQDRNSRSSGRYVLVDGTPIADNWADLTDGDLFSAIKLTSFGGDPPAAFTEGQIGNVVWTGANAAGFPTGADCDGWVNIQGIATVGQWSNTSAAWSEITTDTCGFRKPIYCIEQ